MLRVIALATLVLSSTIPVHLHLVSSVPAADSLAAVPVREIRLTFSERPEIGFSRVRLLSADSAEIPLGAIAVATDDSMTIVAPVSGRLSAGPHRVRWQTAGRDGHVLRGEFVFTAPEDTAAAAVVRAPAADSAAGSAGRGGFPVMVVAIAAAGALAAFLFLRGRR
jgi:methionine-rich copper-binding protein CopC